MERECTRYRQSAFDYVSKLQGVHAQKQYELIEPVSCIYLTLEALDAKSSALQSISGSLVSYSYHEHTCL